MKSRGIEQTAYWGMRIVTYAIIFVIAYIIYDIFINGIGVISWDFLLSAPRKSGAEGGIFPAIVGTIALVTGAIIVALPLGMASAIYLNEYGKQGRLSESIRLAIVTLAGVPSIVFGLFGLGLFVLFLGFGASIISGALTLALMILPTIIVSSEEALKAVPRSYRDGSLALGATKWQTIQNNVLPLALPGMLTGSILGIGRAAGETAPILLTVAAFYLPKLPHSIFDQVMALPYHLYILATQHPDTAAVRPMQYGTALTLITLVLAFNIGAIILRSRFQRRFKSNH